MIEVNKFMALLKTNDLIVKNYYDLVAGIVSIGSSLLVFIYCMNISSDFKISIKSGYSFLAWGIFTVSSILFYFIRSKGTAVSGGYINPFFAWFLKILQIIPFIGFALALINNSEFILKNSTWELLVSSSVVFLDSILILFIFAHFGAGITHILRFIKKDVGTK